MSEKKVDYATLKKAVLCARNKKIIFHFALQSQEVR